MVYAPSMTLTPFKFISSDNKSKLYPKDHVFRYQDARVDTIRQISENCFFDIFINPSLALELEYIMETTIMLPLSQQTSPTSG